MVVAPMELLRANLSRVRIPEPTNRIFKHECDTPRAEGGLFIDMNDFLAFGKDYVSLNYTNTGDPVYLHIKQTRKPNPEDRPLKKPTLLATGVDVGFDNSEAELKEEVTIPVEECRKDKKVLASLPSGLIQCAVSCIFERMSEINLDRMTEMFHFSVLEEHYPWFAKYLISYLVAMDIRRHELFLEFLVRVDSKTLYDLIIEYCIKAFKDASNPYSSLRNEERYFILSNLGRWLGRITIGREIDITNQHFELKELIIEAYENGSMMALIPFVVGVLMSCITSIKYSPPNAWTMSILRLLAEVLLMQNLRFGLRRDIVFIFDYLAVDFDEITPTDILANKTRRMTSNQDFYEYNRTDNLQDWKMEAELKEEVTIQDEECGNDTEVLASLQTASDEEARVVDHHYYALLGEAEELLKKLYPTTLPPEAKTLTQLKKTLKAKTKEKKKKLEDKKLKLEQCKAKLGEKIRLLEEYNFYAERAERVAEQHEDALKLVQEARASVNAKFFNTW